MSIIRNTISTSWPTGAAAFAAALLFSNCAPTASAGASELPPKRQAQLGHMVRHDCGSCHGIELKGGLGPALTPDVLKYTPAEAVAQWIANGRAERGMPAWSALLTPVEIRYIAQGLKKGTFLNVDFAAQ